MRRGVPVAAGWALAGVAWAHGPAPSPLGVLAVDDIDACGAMAGAVPTRLRTVIGLATRRADGAYTYGCPSRWGDQELALVAQDPSGGLLFAGSTAAWWSADGGCRVDPVPWAAGEVAVAVAPAPSGAWLVVSRPSGGALRRVDGAGAVEVDAWDDGRPTAVAVAGEAVHIGIDGGRVRVGSTASGWRTVSLAGAEGTVVRPRRVAPGGGGGDAHVEGFEGVRIAAYDVDEAAIAPGPWPVGGRALGPVAVPGWGDVVAVDQIAYDADGTSLGAVSWTFLQGAGGVAFAGVLGGVLRLEGTPDGLAAVPVFAMAQLAPPEASCPDPQATCALDWAHFGGESGWLATEPALCPDDVRTTPPPPPEPGGCGGERGAGWGVLALITGLVVPGARGRRRPSSG